MDKTCRTCRYEHWPAYSEPCDSCYRCGQHGDKDKWEPKEEKMENEKKDVAMTKIDTEAELRKLQAQVEELQEELEQEKEKNKRQQQSVIDGLNNELGRKNGMIDGLKFAIRCNGVSGAEV